MCKNKTWKFFERKFWVTPSKLTLKEVENIAFWNGIAETKLENLRSDTNQQIDESIKKSSSFNS